MVFWIFGLVLIMWFFFIGSQYSGSNDVPSHIRPKLQGDYLDSWTAIYQANCIQYQHSVISVNTLADITWRQYAELTGNAEWIDNPEYDAQEEN